MNIRSISSTLLIVGVSMLFVVFCLRFNAPMAKPAKEVDLRRFTKKQLGPPVEELIKAFGDTIENALDVDP
jgi:hypothetical protein